MDTKYRGVLCTLASLPGVTGQSVDTHFHITHTPGVNGYSQFAFSIAGDSLCRVNMRPNGKARVIVDAVNLVNRARRRATADFIRSCGIWIELRQKENGDLWARHRHNNAVHNAPAWLMEQGLACDIAEPMQ